jgi:hypothetical protein
MWVGLLLAATNSNTQAPMPTTARQGMYVRSTGSGRHRVGVVHGHTSIAIA